jgi:hypothetical protein
MQRSVLLGLGGLIAALTLSAGAAEAYPYCNRWGRWCGGPAVVVAPGYYAAPVYAAPPVVYAPPPVYYAPSPVYYGRPAIGVGVALPGVAVGLNLPLR